MSADYVWYTNDTHRFMTEGDGYLRKGQTIDERVTEICNAAEKLLKKSGFANKFKEYFKRGFYSFSTPIWVNFGTDRGLPISCVIGSTPIMIAPGVSKPAEEVKVGDKILSHLGRAMKVTAVMPTKGRDDIYALKVAAAPSEIFITGNHLVMTADGWVCVDQLDPLLNVVAFRDNSNNLVFSDIEYVKKTDMVADVYDFTVDYDHTFLANGIVVHNCYNSYIGDSIESIMGDAHAEISVMTKNGGGTSAFFGDIRERGAPIKGGANGHSFGSVHFAGHYQSLIQTASQGNARRGNFAAYWPIDHNDIMEVLRIKQEGHPIQHIYSGVTVPDDWLTSMISGDRKKREVWAALIEARQNTGVPYILFIDTINKNRPQWYKDQGLNIRSSNLCVTGDQRVVSDRGMITARELYEEGGDLVLFDNKKTVRSSPMRLIEKDAPVYRITLANGMTHTVTSYHKVSVRVKGGTADVACKDLAVGDAVAFQVNKGLFGKEHRPKEAFLAGAGYTENDKSSGLCVASKKRTLIPDWIWRADEETVCQYVRGLFDVDDIKSGYLSLTSIDKQFLRTVQLLLANLGMTSKISKVPSEFGGKGYYGLTANNNPEGVKFSKVVSVEFVGKEDVYCCTVDSAEHHWVCNGFITHNCSEVTPTSNEDESFVCDLSSMNITKYDQWKNTDAVEMMVYFLDAVMTEFIEKASSIRFMERAVRYAKRHRSLGIGWFGWHHYLQSKNVPFESWEAKRLNAEVGRTIQTKSISASREMAKEYGEPEVTRGYGVRHALLQAIAPTTSSSFIIGQTSESIEPLTGNYEIKDLAKGKYTIINPYMLRMLDGYGKNDTETLNSILTNGGSVQHLKFLTDHDKLVFRTFAETSQLEVVQQAGQRQQYIDQSQSLNLFLTPKTPTKDINKLLIEAWKCGVKSLYYNKGFNAAQQFTRSLMTCVSCEA